MLVSQKILGTYKINDTFQSGPLPEVLTTPKTTTMSGFESVRNLSAGYGNEFALFKYRLQVVN